MKVCVFGLWHLGCVTAACLAKHHEVVGLDVDGERISQLNLGIAPIFEPGLNDLIASGQQENKLTFTTESRSACSTCDVLWVTIDTPVNQDDVADNSSVIRDILNVLPSLPQGALVLVSSQLPVGTCRELSHASQRPDLLFACSPENLRLGKAIEIFQNPDRVIVGFSDSKAGKKILELFAPITDQIIEMTTESAEMTKHAINGFLALSITYMNELAMLCEQTGADAKEVEHGLKSESRIGPKAYLSPGCAFAGGTLARDVVTLMDKAAQHEMTLSVIPAIKASNDAHRLWEYRTLRRELGDLSGRVIGILGLTYKPGTDTLRRSTSVELCLRLVDEGVRVRAFDPAIRKLPPELERVELLHSIAELIEGCEALVLMTPWPLIVSATWENLLAKCSRETLFIDANRTITGRISTLVRTFSVGQGASQV